MITPQGVWWTMGVHGKPVVSGGVDARRRLRFPSRLSARRLPLGLPLHRVLRYAQKTLALRETPRHLAALAWCGSTLHGGPGRSERLSVVVLPERPPSVHRAHPCPTRTSPRPDVSCPHACCRFTGNCSPDDFIPNALSRNFSLGKSVRPAEHDAEEWWHADDGHRHHRCNEPGIAGLRMPPA
jgi:hypothetical protein